MDPRSRFVGGRTVINQTGSTVTIQQVIGRVLIRVEQVEDTDLTLFFADGSKITFTHYQDCCETVLIDDVNGDWSDLYKHPLLVAEERSLNDFDDVIPDELRGSDFSNTWTFYTFRSVGGSVDVRWHGSSNGYYSEDVRWTFYPVSTEEDHRTIYGSSDRAGVR